MEIASSTDKNSKKPCDKRYTVLVLDSTVSALISSDESLSKTGDYNYVYCSRGGSVFGKITRYNCAAVIMGATLSDMPVKVFLNELAKIQPHVGLIFTSPPPHADDLSAFSSECILQLRERYIDADVADAVEKILTTIKKNSVQPVDTATVNKDILSCISRLNIMTHNTPRKREAIREICRELAILLNFKAVAIMFSGQSASTEKTRLVVHAADSAGNLPLATIAQELSRSLSTLIGTKIEPGIFDAANLDEQHETQNSDLCFLTLPLIQNLQVCGTICLINDASFTNDKIYQAFTIANNALQHYLEYWFVRNRASRDQLTNLYNKEMFLDLLQQDWLLCHRNNCSLSMLLIDIDRFKSLNDRHGHIVGDRVLQESANLIRTGIRASDIAARFGGDEFAIILPEAGVSDAHGIANRLLDIFRQHIFFNNMPNERVTISIGLATMLPSTENSLQQLMETADKTLYRAKQNGRNRVCSVEIKTEKSQSSDQNGSDLFKTGGGNGTILIVDDEPLVLQILGRIANTFKYETTLCGSLEEAISTLNNNLNGFDLVVTDLKLGKASGTELLDLLQKTAPLTIKIVISGYATKELAIKCLKHGAFDFIEKPFSVVQIQTALQRAMDHRRLILNNQRYQQHLEELVRQRSESLTKALISLRQSYSETIRSLATTLDVREHQTGLHSRQVSEASRILGRQMRLPVNILEKLEMGALLHDIGKIGIPDAILLKDGELTADEWQIMRSHCRVGYDMLWPIPFLQDAAIIALSHHERYDGTGYPTGLKGNEISIEARIFAVADAYHAMRSDRPYKKAITPEQARIEIINGAGKQFDPQVVEAFEKCQDEIEAIFAMSNAKAEI